jgi:Dullard-like phosphatase family protein
MRNNFDNNLLYNHYSSLNLKNYYSIQNNISSKSPSSIFNYNKLNPSAMERNQSMKNSRNISIPNTIFSIKTNSTINLNTLDIQNNESKTKNIIQKSLSSKLEINKNNNLNTNYISPISLQNKTNVNTIKLSNINSTNIDNHNFAQKKTLILDLDETLVHSRFREFNRKSDIVLNININDIRHTIHVLKRPNVDHFIKEMSKFYNIFIFTASISQYASPLIDKLDQGKLIIGRLFRQHCINNNGKYIKDIKQVGKDLKDVIIIDNNPISYYLNQDNGIPIPTWYDDINDNELNKLIPLLIYLSNANDVRTIIKQVLNAQKTKIDFNIVNSLINKKMTGSGDYKIYVNLNKDLFDNKKYEYNINEINNDIIDSFSNMTIDEMQREEFSHTFNENSINMNNNKNLYNNDVISSDNDNIFKRTNDLFNQMNQNHNNVLNEEFPLK